MKDFKNKVVVITGAGSGIGRALALDFAKRGAFLALNDFKENTLQETVGLLKIDSTKVMTALFDVSSETAMNQFAQDVQRRFGRVDVMINNAGVAQENSLVNEILAPDFEWLLGINMWGTVYGSRAFLPLLRQQKESSLVNISSVAGLTGVPGLSSYCLSKFAVRGLTESIMIEEQINKTGVCVSCVHPGGVQTNIAKSARGANPVKTAKFEAALRTTPLDAAKIIIKGIQKKKNRILVGPDAYLIYYLNKLARPFLIRGIISYYNKMK